MPYRSPTQLSRSFFGAVSAMIKNGFCQYHVERRGSMKSKKEKVSMTIDSDLLQELRFYAQMDDRSLSQYVNRILRRYMEKRSNR